MAKRTETKGLRRHGEPRPGRLSLRPMVNALPLVQPHQRAHTYCAYCPKLCRFSCPVSTAQGSETTTPWAKMTSLHHAAQARLDVSESVSASWYACSGCMRCRSNCDHDNDVCSALNAGRAEAVRLNKAPKSALDVIDRFEEKQTRAADAALALFGDTEKTTASTVFAPGCTSCVLRPEDAVRGLSITAALRGADTRTLADRCCGLPLLEAGDPNGFVQHVERYIDAASDAEQVVMQDPGCLYAIRTQASRLGVEVPNKFVHLTEFADEHRNRLNHVHIEGPLRYHDPCKLGRGLGVYDAPRRVLSKVLGRPLGEFFHNRDNAECSGAGGQLPTTDPATADKIAEERIETHREAGGGTIVTACPGSADRFTKRGANVISFTEIVDRALTED